MADDTGYFWKNSYNEALGRAVSERDRADAAEAKLAVLQERLDILTDQAGKALDELSAPPMYSQKTRAKMALGLFLAQTGVIRG